MPRNRSDNDTYSGRIALRLPRSLHRRCMWFAKREGISLNALLVQIIAEAIGAREAIERLKVEIPIHVYTPTVSTAGARTMTVYPEFWAKDETEQRT